MYKSSLLIFVFLLGTFVHATAQKTDTAQAIEVDVASQLPDVVIKEVAVYRQTPMAFEKLNLADIQRNNHGQDIPLVLENTVSAVATSDAGNGIGYTGIRIRGVDASRINVTLNGIPYNDAESQAVFWVNLPDLASSTQSIQIQRGIGSTTIGGGAFGGSLALRTTSDNTSPYISIDNRFGSFNARRHTVQASTGLIANRFILESRLSKIQSDGYVDRASADLQSLYVSGQYKGDKVRVWLNAFSGHEVTGQAWNGIDSATLADNRTYNSAGTDFGTFFPAYENDVDDYRQDQFQGIFAWDITENSLLKVNTFYTRGKGFYENYASGYGFGINFADLGLDNIITDGGDTITSTHIVKRRWLDNEFYGFSTSYTHSGIEHLDLIAGGGYHRYSGRHFGTLPWMQYAGAASPDYMYYDGSSVKSEVHGFAKINYNPIDRLHLYGDLQLRQVNYEGSGIEDDRSSYAFEQNQLFINPKTGISYFLQDDHVVYASYAYAGREATRADLLFSTKDANGNTTIRPEYMHDIEIGWRGTWGKSYLNVNGYLMRYKDQLVLSGALDPVGNALRINVEDSDRMGIEIDGRYQVNSWLNIRGNIALSNNRFIDSDSTGANVTQPLAYSPNAVSSVILGVEKGGFAFDLINKYVGKQYLDNSGLDAVSIPSYFVCNAQAQYTTTLDCGLDLGFHLRVNNLTNTKYVSNGYVYAGFPSYYPQATINAMGGVSLRFAGKQKATL
ncbi:MAG: TonB-dependent receptor [Chitinophagales bacterium]